MLELILLMARSGGAGSDRGHIQDGEARGVLMDVESYNRMRSAVALLKIVSQGEADVAAGRLLSQEEAFARAAGAIDDKIDA